MTAYPRLIILGGGPAGLAVGFYARKFGLPFLILEASHRTGGHAVTLQHGDFRFDSGAHRFHDQDTEVTREVKSLLGQELREISVPSCIYHAGQLIDFPPSPLDLILKLGMPFSIKAAIDLAQAKLKSSSLDGSFEEVAVARYGRTVADLFLLNYSQKLWGKPCQELSPQIAGRRLNGLSLTTFLKEALGGKRAKNKHLDGSFYYPRSGYGAIVDKLAEFCGSENIRLNARITKILHTGQRIEALEINQRERLEVQEVVSTLPLSLLVRMLVPSSPQKILELAGELKFRNLIVIAVFLKKERITRSATIYFPGAEVPFTRVYEPRNRSPEMSPPGFSSLCAEVPCDRDDPWWSMPEEELVALITSHYLRLGWIKQEEILDAKVLRLNHAYPVLDRGIETTVQQIHGELRAVENLWLVGRNAEFLYASLHTMMRSGLELIKEYIASRG